MFSVCFFFGCVWCWQTVLVLLVYAVLGNRDPKVFRWFRIGFGCVLLISFDVVSFQMCWFYVCFTSTLNPRASLSQVIQHDEATEL